MLQGRNRLGAQLAEHAGADECGDELLAEDAAELATTDAVAAPQVDHGPRADRGARVGHLVPAGEVPGSPAYRRVRRNTLISSWYASRVCARPFRGARAEWRR